MKEQIDDGGSAFPGISDSRCGYDPYDKNYTAFESIPGMSLRDWFAGQATEEDIEHHKGGTINPQTGNVFGCFTRERAKYHYADAMLAARKEAQ